jgi:hypothetical protein
MIGVFLTFRYSEGFDAERLRTIAENGAPTFDGLAGLRSKTFTLNAAKREAINFYVWESEEAAKRLYDETVMARVTSLYGVRPTVDTVEIAVLVDNAARR